MDNRRSELVEGAHHSVSLLRGQPILVDYVYRIRQGRKSAFLYENLDTSRGSNVHWRCIALKKAWTCCW